MADNININNSLEQLSFEDMPIDEEDFVPINNVQLAKSLYEYAKHIQQNDIEKFYNDFKELVEKYVIGDNDMKLKIENVLRARVRKLLFESGDWDNNGSWDPADIAADEDEEYQRKLAADTANTDKQTYDKIASSVGAAGPSGVKRIEGAALSKLKFLIQDMSPQEVEGMKTDAAKDYVKHLESSKALEQDEIDLLQNNLDIVMSLDGYRDFLRKYILATARKKGVKL